MDEKRFNALSKPQQDVVIKIAAEAERQGVNPAFAIAVAEAETRGRFNHYSGDKVTTSPAGARGLMQIMPDTARLYNKKYGVNIDPDDEDSNIMGGVTILKDLLTTYKNPRKAVALYNASPKANATFLKLYDTDPDAAIMSLPKETRDYSLRVSQNFNLDDEKETGLISPIQGAESDEPETEGERMKREGASIDPNATTEPVDDSMFGKAKQLYKENVDNNLVLAGLGGAGKGYVEKVLTDPSLNMFGPDERTPAEVRSANDKFKNAQTNLNSIAEEIENRKASGASIQDLEQELRMKQNAARQAQQELQMATQEAKKISGAPMPVVEPAPIVEAEPRAGRASGPKIENDSGTRNWMIQEAGQKHQLPETILDMATGKSKDSPTGGKALIDKDLANLEKIKQLGMGESKLTTTPSGVQLQLPADVASSFESELAQRQEADRLAQEKVARANESQRLAQEQQLQQQRQQAEQKTNIKRNQKITLGEEAAEAKRLRNAELQKLASEEKALSKANIGLRTAAQTAQDVEAAQPSAWKIATREAGRKLSERAPMIGNALGAVGATMSVDEALKRFNEGDTSGGVINTLEAGLNLASMATPTSPISLMIKGVGAVGSLAIIPAGLLHDYIKGVGSFAKTKNPPQKAMGGLTLMR